VGREADDGSTVEERLGESKARVAVDLITDLTAQGEKVVVFAHFRPDLDILQKRLEHLHVPVFRIDGSTPKKDRMYCRTGFRDSNEAAVMLAQMRTMSLGVNELTVAAYGIVYSLSDRRDDFDQALDRLDRQGQTRPVTIYHLAVPKSVDEWMLRAHQQKLDLEAAITRKDAAHFMTLGRGA
jgi:SNF2 family DNA or RNA helicase